MWDYTKDEKIKEALNENPFLSVRLISAQTTIAPSTVHWILTTRMDYKNEHLKKIHHVSTCDMKRKRVEGSRALRYISMFKKNNFRYFSTGDVSFFLYNPVKKTIWLPNDQEPPKTSTNHNELQKIILYSLSKSFGFFLLQNIFHSSLNLIRTDLFPIIEWCEISKLYIYEISLEIHQNQHRMHKL